MAAAGALALEFLASILFPSIEQQPAVKFGPTLILFVIIEETVKYSLLKKGAEKTKPKRKIFPAAFFFGSGFALIEIALNIAAYPYLSSALLLIYTSLFLVHASTALILGYFLVSRGTSFRKSWPAFLSAFLLHAAFNSAVTYGFGYLLADGILVIITVFIFSKYTRHSSLP